VVPRGKKKVRAKKKITKAKNKKEWGLGGKKDRELGGFIGGVVERRNSRDPKSTSSLMYGVVVALARQAWEHSLQGRK